MAPTKKTRKIYTAKQFAPIGLWLAYASLIAAVLLVLFKLLVVAKLYTLSNSNWLNLSLWISVLLIFLGLGLFSLLNPLRIREFLGGRQAHYGSNAAIRLVAFISILIVINIFAFKNPGKPLDLTEDKKHTLAPETLNVLKALSAPIQATGFFTSNNPSASAQTLLDNYSANANGKFTFKFVDPNQDPITARNAGISGDGKIYLQMGDQHEIVASASEQDITAALIRLMNPGEHTVYFLTGHGERNIDTAADDAFTSVKAALVARNYTVKTLNLLATNSIPDNAKTIIIAGPQKPITTGEMTLLQDYVSKGGTLVVMEDPIPMTQYGTSPDPLSAYLATTWTITLDNDIVIDTNSSQPFYAVASAYASHPITDKLQGLVSFFPTVRSLSITTVGGVQPVHLVTTVNQAWGETDFDALSKALQGNGQIGFNQGVDLPGPLTLAMAAEDTAKGSRIVVFGDSDFASDKFFNQYANGDIFINAIDWTAGQEKMINLTTPKTINRTLNPLSSTTLVLLLLFFIIVLPGLVIAGGIASWLMRRSRG